MKMKKITKPGVFKGLSYAEYDAIPALRSTYLKKFLHCPANAKVKDEETDALIFGTAAHCFILEGQREFEKRYAVIPKFDGDKRSGIYRLLKNKTIDLAKSQGKIVLDYEDHKAIRQMKVNVLSHPTAKLLIGKNEPELVVVWKDSETNLLCKARLDVSPYMDLRVIPDLKTTINTSERGFKHEIDKHHYDFSAGMYLEGASIVLGKKIDLFVIIAPEKKPPYRIHVHELSSNYIERGNVAFHEALRKEKACIKSGYYEPWLDGGIIVQEP